MARMFPERLPDHVESAAERLLYHQFRRQLPDSFVVLHSVKWLMRDRRHHDHDGEIDFLIVHAELGILILEVKGGRIRVDAGSGRWYTMNHAGRESELKLSPFDQAQRNLYHLKAKLEEAPRTRPYTYRFQRGVAFPDLNVGSTNIGLYGPRELMIDSTDVVSLEESVRRILGAPLNKPLSPQAVKSLVDTLQPTLEFHRIGMNTQVLKSEEQIANLTTDQFFILDSLGRRPKALISGCAGSGKTMLAMEKARRLANEGFHVLFTCFNKNLGAWIRDLFASDQFTSSDRILVTHYHGLAFDLCKRSGVVLPEMPSSDNPIELDNYWNDILPQKLHDAVNKLTLRFDAIIVDEGQDFAEMWWIPLLDLQRNKEQGVFYIFYDDNQHIYPREMSLPINEVPFILTINCRNTDLIHAQVLSYYQGNPHPISRGPQGIHPEFVPLGSSGDREALRQVFRKLFTDERLPTNQVVILTPRGPKTSDLKEGDRIGSVTLTWNPRPGPGMVKVSSIYSFKGLESPVVVLAELHKLEKTNQDYLLYVATSRPRSHLIVLGTLPEPQSQVPIAPQTRWASE